MDANLTTMAPVAVVTGGNRGLGFEVCRQLQAIDYYVVLGSREGAAGREAAQLLGERVTGIQLDVTDQASVDAAAGWVLDRFGRCDTLVNNAGVGYDTDELASAADLARVERALETNLFGTWRVCLAFLPMLSRSPQARIVNVSSREASLTAMGGGKPGYHVSKTAQNALTRTLAAELHDRSILVNAISPGWTATDMGGRGGRPVADGAASIVWGVTLSEDGPSGGFFEDGQPVPW